MNHLAHHFVARSAFPEEAPAFYVANVLPDLLARSGGGARLRPHHAAAAPDTPLLRGIALHFSTDRLFHTSAAFRQAMAEASDLLRATPFPTPLRRVFFLAHVFVELVLDAVLLRADRTLADHLYWQFDVADLPAIAEGVEDLMARPLPGTLPGLERFADRRYLYDYADPANLSGVLRDISRRAGLENFPLAEDRTRLGEAFADFLPRAAELSPSLLALPLA